jgi:hypothetical protein
MKALLNFVLFQIGWFSSVLGAASNMPWLGPVVFVAVFSWHLRGAQRPDLEAGLVLACGIVGTWFDSLLVATGWVAYPAGQFSSVMAPYWIITMWMLFATTLNISMGWLRGKRLLAAVLGAIAGPASYYAGQKLGGIEFREPAFAVLALGIGWAFLMPLVLELAERLNGFEPNLQRVRA